MTNPTGCVHQKLWEIVLLICLFNLAIEIGIISKVHLTETTNCDRSVKKSTVIHNHELFGEWAEEGAYWQVGFCRLPQLEQDVT